ncbi:MAG: NB-ARC domain-containing protein, partial [Pseudonocardiaceae bacterium]
MVDGRAERSVPDQIQGRNPHHVNHDEELAEAEAVSRRRDGNQIVVFAGGPGVGKTAAGLELSFRVRDGFPSGRLFGRLSAGLDQPGVESDVLRDFLGALGEGAHDIPDRLDARRARYQQLTAGGRFQVFLDGAVSASQVRALLPGDGASLVVVTEGRPLSALVSDSPVTFVELSPLRDEPARELLDRLAGADSAAEPDAVGEAIRLCGNLPIALCVVGALVRRSRSRTFASVVERLRDERRRLSTLSRDEDLSVTSVFTAAYRLLGDSAQRCYVALGLRPRSTEISADALSAALDLADYEVVEALTELADARMVEEIATDRVGVRDLVQLHAEQLDQRPVGERNAETMRLLRYYLTRATAADDLISPLRPWRDSLFPGLERGEPFDDEDAARRWLRSERANLCAAVEHAFDIGEFELVVQWCVLLWA